MKQNKPTILTFVGHYLPGYKSGGPIRTISNLLDALSDDFNFKIITRDRDQFDNEPYGNIKVNEWNSFNNCNVFYARRETSLINTINKSSFDIYYLNSLFDYNFSIKIILLLKLKLIPRKQVLLAPRGELSKGALSLKAIKKKIFIHFVKFLRLYKDVYWQASSEYEAAEIKIAFGSRAKIEIAMDVPAVKNIYPVERRKKKKSELKILFISSITPKKNVRFAIETLKKVKGNFILDIYGPIKDKNYWAKCQQLISSEIRDRITYKGTINNKLIHTIYPEYDLFFFPTLGENFGHVIFESLVYGTPVLCSGTTPWDKLDELRAGWNLDLNYPEKFITLIEQLIEKDEYEYQTYIDGCREYIKLLKNMNIEEANRIMFRNLTSSGKAQ